MAEEEYNKGGYESMVWIRDKDGNVGEKKLIYRRSDAYQR